MAINTTQLASPGTLGLPHFKSSAAATNLYEPVYLNLYTVQILNVPAGMPAEFVPGPGLNLVLENVTKVSGLDTLKIPAAGATQTYKYATRSFANAGPESTYIDVKFDFEVNLNDAHSMYVVKFLQKWGNLIYDPLTGRMGLKKDYVADNIIVTQHDRALNSFRQWTLHYGFPTTNITTPELDYAQKDQLYRISGFTLRVDSWEEVIL
jgi:hypothetical protein